MMELTQMDYGYAFTQENGNVVALTWKEFNFLAQEMEKMRFRDKLKDEINIEDDFGNLDFSRISKEEFVSLCMDEALSKYEIYGDSFDSIDIEDLVFDLAQEYSVWKE